MTGKSSQRKSFVFGWRVGWRLAIVNIGSGLGVVGGRSWAYFRCFLEAAGRRVEEA